MKILTILDCYIHNDTILNKLDSFIDKLKSIAQLDSMTPERFTACVNNSKLQEKILNNFIEARKALKLESAPTFFINGELSQGYVDYLTIKKIIDRQLAEPK